jgi:hypothetical protein
MGKGKFGTTAPHLHALFTYTYTIALKCWMVGMRKVLHTFVRIWGNGAYASPLQSSRAQSE